MTPVSMLHGAIGGVATLVVTSLLLLVAAFIVRFDRSWPSRLLLVGASASVIYIWSDFLWVTAFERGWLQRFNLLEGCMLKSSIATPLELIELLSFFVPLAFLWYCVRALRWGLTKRWSEPPPAVRSHFR